MPAPAQQAPAGHIDPTVTHRLRGLAHEQAADQGTKEADPLGKGFTCRHHALALCPPSPAEKPPAITQSPPL
jgi:hypothetical protein